MRKKVCDFIELINGFMILTGVAFLMALVLRALLDYDFKEHFCLFLPALLGIYAITLIADRVSRGFLLYLVMVLAGLAATLLLPMKGIPRVMSILSSCILIVLSMVSRLKDNDNPLTRPKPFLPVFFALVYMTGVIITAFDLKLMTTTCYYLTFASAILFVIYKNFTRLELYLTTNQFVQNIPTSQIDRTNVGSLAIYLVIMVAGMILLPLTKAEVIFVYLWKGFKYLLKLLFGGLGTDVDTPDPRNPEDISGAEMGPPNIGAEGETPAWLTALYNILTYVMLGIIGIIVLVVIILAIVRLIRKFYKPYSDNDDIQEFIDKKADEKSSTLPKLGDILKRPDWLDFSPNAVVRRAFKKAIQKGNRETPQRSMTPAELEAFAGLPEGEDTDLLHTLYEKARYTEGGVTKEEAKLIKSRA